MALSVVMSLPAVADVILQNGELSLTIGNDGLVKSLVQKSNGRECLQSGVDAPVCVITQYRPYDNENFLMFPAKPRSFPSNKCYMSGDTLCVEFNDTYDIVKIKVDITPDYIAFTPVDRDYRIEDYGVKRKTELDELGDTHPVRGDSGAPPPADPRKERKKKKKKTLHTPPPKQKRKPFTHHLRNEKENPSHAT